jgi:hypothetical protein
MEILPVMMGDHQDLAIRRHSHPPVEELSSQLSPFMALWDAHESSKGTEDG